MQTMYSPKHKVKKARNVREKKVGVLKTNMK